MPFYNHCLWFILSLFGEIYFLDLFRRAHDLYTIKDFLTWWRDENFHEFWGFSLKCFILFKDIASHDMNIEHHINLSWMLGFSRISLTFPHVEQLWDKSISYGFHDLQLYAIYVTWYCDG